MARRDDRLKSAGQAVFIQCVGSRTPEYPYCSKICCTHSLKSAIALKEINPEMEVFVLYRDMRSYGFREDLYRTARKLGVFFIRYDMDNPPEVDSDKDRLRIIVKDHVLNMPLELRPDLLVLAAGVRPNPNQDLFELFKVPINADGYLVEAHAKLRPVDFASEGIFMAGLAHYPKPIDETIAQARAAASRAMTILAKDFIRVGGVVADLADPDRCACCLVCVRSCPYGVPRVKDGRAHINPAECHGCGICAAECPAKVITLQHFTDDQILAKTHAMFADEGMGSECRVQ
jgi:heterodisulfide reductase subunit A